MPQDRLALAVLRAALSPDLKASSLVFSSPRTSAVIHGFWFARVVMVLVTHIINALFDVSSHSLSVLLQLSGVVIDGRLFNLHEDSGALNTLFLHMSLFTNRLNETGQNES